MVVHSYNPSPNRSPYGGGDATGVGVAVVTGITGVAMFPLFSLALPIFIGAGVMAAWTSFVAVRAAADDRTDFAAICMWLCVLLMVLLQPLTVWLHWAPWAPMGWAIAGLYTLGIFAGAARALEGAWRKVLAFLFIGVAVGVFVVLPPPDAAGNPDDEAAKWTVVVEVRDSEGRPIEDARAQCTSVMMWERDKDFDADYRLIKHVDEEGNAEFEFHGDTRFKAAFCGAFKPARSSRTPGYALRTAMLVNPFRGGKFTIRITLDQRTDLDEGDFTVPMDTTPVTIDANTGQTQASSASGDASGSLPPEVAEAVRLAREESERALAVEQEALAMQTRAETVKSHADIAANSASNVALRARLGASGLHTFTTSDGYRYEGGWYNGQQSGSGVATWPSGQRYAGGYLSGDRHGHGTLGFADDSHVDVYRGQFINDERSGLGVMSWRDGDAYAGEFRADRRNGLGVMSYASGGSRAGRWTESVTEGPTVERLASGDSFIGAWSGGTRNGYGIYRYSSGARYEGQFYAGKRHGLGAQWNDEGELIRAGEWRDGVFTTDMRRR